ncbi:MAG: hypothetical protein F6K26_24695 [Moorea sp. SIO2I5]|nr:hypothetical protein [Moorena sp. SIO2I5]
MSCFYQDFIDIQHLCSDPWYPSALNSTWLFVSKNIETFKPREYLSLPDALTKWINAILNNMMKKERSWFINPDLPLYEISKQDEVIITLKKIIEYQESLKAEKKRQVFSKLFQDFEKYVSEDPKGLLINCHSQKCSKCNCQYLTQQKIYKRRWNDILQDLNIGKSAALNLWKKCKEILKDILEDLGYTHEEEDQVIIEEFLQDIKLKYKPHEKEL